MTRPDARVGVVGPDPDALTDRVRAAGGEATAGDVGAVLDADPDVVVALGERALVDCARARPDRPLLAVEAGRGVYSVPRSALPHVAEALVGGESGWTARTRPLFAASVGDAGARALFDVTLVTDPMEMSEYAVRTVDEAGDRLPVSRFRADGVVLATAAGSHDYANDAGGPAMAPGVEALAAVPIAPYTVEREHWVLDAPATLTVEREEGHVTLFVDGREVAPVSKGSSVRVERDGAVDLVALPQARGRGYFPRGDRLEKT